MMREDFVKMCALLNEHQVEYLVVGGMAVIYHGYVRSTADIDIWYNPTNANFIRVVGALRERGIDTSDLEQIVFDPKKTFLKIPLSVRTEFLPFVHDTLKFSEAKSRAEIMMIDEVPVPILGYDHLVMTKKFANRLKDQADLDELAKRRNRPEENGGKP
jgi:hypothetical protein